MEDLFVYDPTAEDFAFGRYKKPEGKHWVQLDDGTYKLIPDDEIEF